MQPRHVVRRDRGKERGAAGLTGRLAARARVAVRLSPHERRVRAEQHLPGSGLDREAVDRVLQIGRARAHGRVPGVALLVEGVEAEVFGGRKPEEQRRAVPGEQAPRLVVDPQGVGLTRERGDREARGLPALLEGRLEAADRRVLSDLVDLANAEHHAAAELRVEVAEGDVDPGRRVAERELRRVHRRLEAGVELAPERVLVVVPLGAGRARQTLLRDLLQVEVVERVEVEIPVEPHAEAEAPVVHLDVQPIDELTAVVVDDRRRRRLALTRVAVVEEVVADRGVRDVDGERLTADVLHLDRARLDRDGGNSRERDADARAPPRARRDHCSSFSISWARVTSSPGS